MNEHKYTVKEAAEVLGYDDRTIRDYLKKGWLYGYQLESGGGWRIPASEIERYQREGKRPKTGFKSGVKSSQEISDSVHLHRQIGHTEYLATIATRIVQDIEWIRPSTSEDAENIEYILSWHGGELITMTTEDLADLLGDRILQAEREFGELDMDHFQEHLQAEFPEAPTEYPIAFYMEENPHLILDRLLLIARGRKFKGSCPFCSE